MRKILEKKGFDDDKYMFSDVRFYVADKVERGLLP
jgi:hypothetical protein